MSRLLLDEQPLMILPLLATKIGLNEAIVLQQIHYWNEINKKAKNNFKDGYHWTFNSYTEWEQQFPFWSNSTIKRTIHNLEKYHLLVIGNYNRLKIDRTKWYRIDYKVLEYIENQPLGQIEPTSVSRWYQQMVNKNKPLPETNSKITKETNINYEPPSGFTARYLNLFYNYFGYKHRRILKEVDETNLEGLDIETFSDMVIEYFEKYGTNDKQHNLEKCSIDNVFTSAIRYSMLNEW